MKFTKILGYYLVRYLFAFLLIFATNIVLFETAKNSIEGYIVNRVETKMETGIQTFEEMTEKMDLIGQVIYQDSDFTQLIYLDQFEKENIMRIKNSNDLLKQINYITDYTPYMFVLFKNNDIYLSSTQCTAAYTDFYGSFVNIRLNGREEMDASQFKKEIFEKKKSGNSFLKADSVMYIYNGKEVYLQDAVIYLEEGRIPYTQGNCAFGFVLDREYLVQTICGEEYQECFLVITDRKSKEELINYGKIPEGWEPDSKEAKAAQKTGYHIMENLDNKLNLNITAGISEEYIEMQMLRVRFLLILYLGIGLVLAVALAVGFSVGRYRGFRKVLVAFPEEEVELGKKKSFNEYEILSQNVSKLDRKRQAYVQEIERMKEQNKAIMLESLITGGITSGQEGKQFTEYFDREPEFYCVAMVSILQTEGEWDEKIVLDAVQSLGRKKVTVWGNVHSGIANELFLIERLPMQQGNVKDLLVAFEEITGEISRKYHCVLHVGISTVGTGLPNIGKCYEQAKCIIQSQYLYENENIVQVYDISENALYENPITIEFMNRLYAMLISGQYQNIENELERIEGRYSRATYLYESNKRQIFYAIRNVFHTAILQLNCKEASEQLPGYADSLKCHEMIECFKQSAKWLSDYIEHGKKSKNEMLKERIISFLEKNYTRPGLSAVAVSEKVGITEKYLYQFWKQQTGETFANYLLHLRIDRAKEYLEQTDLSNEQIAELVGFSSANTFYRNFQKLTGITPKKYKESRESWKTDPTK